MGLFKSLIIFATVYCVGINAQVQAKAPPAKPAAAEAAEAAARAAEKDIEANEARSGVNTNNEINKELRAICIAEDKKVEEARKAVATACGESRLGGGESCLLKADQCFQQFSNEENEDMETMYGSMSKDEADKKCPVSTNQAGDLEKKIEKQQEKIEKIEKEALSDKKSTAKAFDELQEEIAKNDSDYKKAKIDTDEAKMKQDVEIDKAFSQIAEDIESTHSQILESQAKLADLMSSKAERLAQMSNAIIQSDCEIKIMEIAAKIPGANSGSSQGMIKAGANKNKTLKTRYNQCIQGMLNARKKLIENYDNSTQQLQYGIARLQTKVKRREEDILKVQKNAQASLENAQKSSDSIDANYNANKLRLANKLSNLSTNTSQQESQNNTNLQKSTYELNRASNDLARIGGEKAKDLKKTFESVNIANDEYYSILNSFPKNQCCPAKMKPVKGEATPDFMATSCAKLDLETKKIDDAKKKSQEGTQ